MSTPAATVIHTLIREIGAPVVLSLIRQAVTGPSTVHDARLRDRVRRILGDQLLSEIEHDKNTREQ